MNITFKEQNQINMEVKKEKKPHDVEIPHHSKHTNIAPVTLVKALHTNSSQSQ